LLNQRLIPFEIRVGAVQTGTILTILIHEKLVIVIIVVDNVLILVWEILFLKVGELCLEIVVHKIIKELLNVISEKVLVVTTIHS